MPAAKIRWLYQCDDVGRNFQFGGYLDSRYSFACYYDSGLRIGKIAIELDGKTYCRRNNGRMHREQVANRFSKVISSSIPRHSRTRHDVVGSLIRWIDV